MIVPIPRRLIAVGVPLMVLVAVAAVWSLLGLGVAGAQLEAIRTGSTVVVGLGGLSALERLAQDSADPALRQTVVNVVCAYLRMPYTEPEPVRVSRPLGPRRPVRPGKRCSRCVHRRPVR
ncbi:MAG: hypothetical protein ACRDSK_03580 [Actinophytocola sp.]|uniref:hypothetical protein n=1 Tax=Actinophytocola sp. TaxID=1872138 RepID=UPI003D6C06D9